MQNLSKLINIQWVEHLYKYPQLWQNLQYTPNHVQLHNQHRTHHHHHYSHHHIHTNQQFLIHPHKFQCTYLRQYLIRYQGSMHYHNVKYNLLQHLNSLSTQNYFLQEMILLDNQFHKFHLLNTLHYIVSNDQDLLDGTLNNLHYN